MQVIGDYCKLHVLSPDAVEGNNQNPVKSSSNKTPPGDSRQPSAVPVMPLRWAPLSLEQLEQEDWAPVAYHRCDMTRSQACTLISPESQQTGANWKY